MPDSIAEAWRVALRKAAESELQKREEQRRLLAYEGVDSQLGWLDVDYVNRRFTVCPVAFERRKQIVDARAAGFEQRVCLISAVDEK